MPSASAELVNKLRCYFPEPRDLESECSKYIRACGGKIVRGVISLPKYAYTKDGPLRECINYLIDEWDYAEAPVHA